MIPEGFFSRFDSNYSLADDEVHVWRKGLEGSALEIAALRPILSSDELRRANQFHFEADRRRCVVGFGMRRLLLSAILRLPAESLRFERNEYGKPRLIRAQERGLQFNLSHSGDLILVAITKGRAVGIDVERIRADLDLDDIAARFFSIDERKCLASVTGSRKSAAFFACWTRKEAYLKARGDGLSVPLDQFDVGVLPDEHPQLLSTRHDPNEVRRWTLQTVPVPASYQAAVAAEGSGWKLKCLDGFLAEGIRAP